jgi:hypothetical protein
MQHKFWESTNPIYNVDKSYPIILADIKRVSQFFQANPTETKYDDTIEQDVIPAVISNWEHETSFILLDTARTATIYRTEETYKGYPPQLTQLNIREVLNLKYFPSDWDFATGKTIIDATNYVIGQESIGEPRRIYFQSKLLLFPIENNLETTFNAGYEENDFTNLPFEIKKALLLQCANNFDSDKGYGCDDKDKYYVTEIYNKYKRLIPIL